MLLDLFRTVFPDSNKLDQVIMDSENVLSIKYCHVNVTNYANQINCRCYWPEGTQTFQHSMECGL
jgi:hypothetical protein